MNILLSSFIISRYFQYLQQHQQFRRSFAASSFSGCVRVTWQRELMSCRWNLCHHLLRTCHPMGRVCYVSSSGRSRVPPSVPLWTHHLFPGDRMTRRDFSGNSLGLCPSYPCERFGADWNWRNWIESFEAFHRPLRRLQTLGLKANLRHGKHDTSLNK